MPQEINKKYYAFALLVFSSAVLITNLIKFKYGCFNAWDTGIYFEAIKKINLTNLNPLIESHGYKIFNDHFDPIIFFPALIKTILPMNWTIFLTEIFFICLATYPVLDLVRKKYLEVNLGYFFIAYMLFNQGTLAAAYYPIHPTTWAIAPMSFLIWGAFQRKYKVMLISLIFLMACKEEFPFTAVMTSLWLVLDSWKNKYGYKEVSVICLVSVVWLVFVLGIRRSVLGGAYFDYAGIFINNLLLDPLGFLREYNSEVWHSILKAFAPLLLLIIILRPAIKKLYWPSLIIAIPIIALRILTGKFGFHYSAVMMIPFLYLFLNKDFSLSKLQLIVLTGILFIFSSQKISEEFLSLYNGVTMNGCQINQKRLSDVDQIVEYDYSNCKRLITSGGVAFVLISNGIDSRAANIDRAFDTLLSTSEKKNCYIFDRESNLHPKTKIEIDNYIKKYTTIFKNDNFIMLN